MGVSKSCETLKTERNEQAGIQLYPLILVYNIKYGL